MRRIALGLLLLATGTVATARNTEGGVIHRCERPDGVLLFTDRPCARFGARDRLPPIGYDATGTAERRRPGIPSPMPVGAVCPRTPEELQRYARIAIEGRDPNALAGLVDWRGMSRGPALQQLSELRRLSRLPLEEVVFDGGGYAGLIQASSAPDTEVFAGDVLTVAQRNPGGDLTTRSFPVRRNLGCYWLSLAPVQPALRLAAD